MQQEPQALGSGKQGIRQRKGWHWGASRGSCTPCPAQLRFRVIRTLTMDDMHETLTKCADDAELQITSCGSAGLVLSVCIPSRRGETWDIRVRSMIHLDMNRFLTLGKVEFGGLELLSSFPQN
jgi:hypothetical protein